MSISESNDMSHAYFTINFKYGNAGEEVTPSKMGVRGKILVTPVFSSTLTYNLPKKAKKSLLTGKSRGIL